MIVRSRLNRRPSRSEIAAAMRYYDSMRDPDGEPPGEEKESAVRAQTQTAEDAAGETHLRTTAPAMQRRRDA